MVAGTQDFTHSNIFKWFQLTRGREMCFTSRQQMWAHRAALLKLHRRHSRKPSPSSFGCTQGSKTRCLLCSIGMTRHSAIFAEFWQHLLMAWKPFQTRETWNVFQSKLTYMLITNPICWDHLGQGAQNGSHKGRDKERSEKKKQLCL